MSIAESPSVAARHSRTPVSSDRSAAGDEPVPGLLNDRNVVVPPNAAATESWKNRSGSASVATRVCVWTSTTPGKHQQPGRIDHLVGAGRETPQVWLDGGDPPAIDRDVGHPRAAGGHDRPTANDQCRVTPRRYAVHGHQEKRPSSSARNQASSARRDAHS